MNVRVPADSTWGYAAASGGISDTTPVSMKAAVTDKRNYVTSLDIQNKDVTVGTEVVIKSGSTVLYRTFAPPGSPASLTAIPGRTIPFDPPLRGGVNEAITVEAVTTSAELYANAQGYTQ